VTVPFETISAEVSRLHNFVVGDLNHMVKRKTGGNYLAAALITCACDTLSHLKYGKKNKGELFFAEVLPSKWHPLAPVLYGAIRHGIVHLYDTKFIRINSRKIDVVISWRMKPHFHRSADGNQIFINVRNLAADFKAALKRFEADLKAQPQLRETFAKAMCKSREVSVGKKGQALWEQSLRDMKVAI